METREAEAVDRSHAQVLVSVIIPVFNGAQYLGDAIDSVLAQTYRPIEVIVVNDGSTDASGSIAERYGPPIRCCHQVHVGIGAARNRGAEEGLGEFLAFLDADDLWVEGKLKSQIAAFSADPSLDMVFGCVRQFHSPELSDAQKRPIIYGRDSAPGYIAGSMTISAAAFQRVKFTTDWRVGEFVDWYLRAAEAGLKSKMLSDVVLLRRVHTDNMGIRERNARSDYVRIVKAALDRRRGRNPGASSTPTASAERPPGD
jgi:glycosyltransferase involved in cell wall biosynthesis